MSIPLFPEATGFVEECLRSVGIMLEDSITQHVLFELTIHVNGKILSNKQKEVEFCRLLSGMLEDVPTEDGPMRVLWARVKRMLEAYRKSVDTAKKNRKFDANWSPGSNPGLRQQLAEPFQIDPPQVLGN
jgi:hypothetical protein